MFTNWTLSSGPQIVHMEDMVDKNHLTLLFKNALLRTGQTCNHQPPCVCAQPLRNHQNGWDLNCNKSHTVDGAEILHQTDGISTQNHGMFPTGPFSTGDSDFTTTYLKTPNWDDPMIHRITCQWIDFGTTKKRNHVSFFPPRIAGLSGKKKSGIQFQWF